MTKTDHVKSPPGAYAIETRYQGYRFRSRLEARWAAFFDQLGWRWEYEPYDENGWIPDFLILGVKPLLVEVKPAASVADLVKLVEPAHVRPEWPATKDGEPRPPTLSERGIPEVLLVGATPRLPGADRYWRPDGTEIEYGAGESDMSGFGFAGWLADGDMYDGSLWTFGEASWHRCRKCDAVAVRHGTGSYAGRPCGHHYGDGYLGEWTEQECRTAWATACNETQWKGRGAKTRVEVAR